MNLFEDLGHLPPREESPDEFRDDEPTLEGKASERFDCIQLATELLDLHRWATGAQIDFLEGVSFGRIYDSDTLSELEEMRDSRQREINLNR